MGGNLGSANPYPGLADDLGWNREAFQGPQLSPKAGSPAGFSKNQRKSAKCGLHPPLTVSTVYIHMLSEKLNFSCPSVPKNSGTDGHEKKPRRSDKATTGQNVWSNALAGSRASRLSDDYLPSLFLTLACFLDLLNKSASQNATYATTR